DGAGKTCKVEILGDGQQMIIDGFHDEEADVNGRPTIWYWNEGKSPWEQKIDKVPTITLTVLNEIIAEIANILQTSTSGVVASARVSRQSTYPDKPSSTFGDLLSESASEGYPEPSLKALQSACLALDVNKSRTITTRNGQVFNGTIANDRDIWLRIVLLPLAHR